MFLYLKSKRDSAITNSTSKHLSDTGKCSTLITSPFQGNMHFIFCFDQQLQEKN